MIPEFIAEVQISYSSHVKAKDRMKVTGSKDAADAFRAIWPAYDHIEFSYMLMMNRQNHILGYHQLSKGGMTGAVVDVRVVFQVALKACATSLILAHNHPSGNLDTSDADRKITRQIKEAGLILDIPLLDHLIMTTDSYLSMADEGLI
ncbi:MAG TPA: JAB domain-containing protein [Prolixibacteraceae bacterium]|nr:JAB domain-containing protein [Prolixibacteraceae bacterium]